MRQLSNAIEDCDLRLVQEVTYIAEAHAHQAQRLYEEGTEARKGEVGNVTPLHPKGT